MMMKLIIIIIIIIIITKLIIIISIKRTLLFVYHSWCTQYIYKYTSACTVIYRTVYLNKCTYIYIYIYIY